MRRARGRCRGSASPHSGDALELAQFHLLVFWGSGASPRRNAARAPQLQESFHLRARADKALFRDDGRSASRPEPVERADPFARRTGALQPAYPARRNRRGGSAAPGRRARAGDRRRRSGQSRRALPRGRGRRQLGIADFDRVEEHNRQRQLLHDAPPSASRRSRPPRAGSARPIPRARRRAWRRHHGRERGRVFSNYDVIIDGTDRFSARYLNNDARSSRSGRWSTAACSSSTARSRSSTPRAAGHATAACFPSRPPPAACRLRRSRCPRRVVRRHRQASSAFETIKLLTGAGEPSSAVLTYSALRQEFQTLTLPAQPQLSALR